jgi:DNA invertase Pin-like site-specific DNA recombinase
MHPKLNDDLLKRRAVVYIRQSSPGQVLHNLESQRRQYGLADHARQLGFREIQVIDADLGRSGSGKVERPGFERLVAEVCSGSVGAVLCIEASRLARNGRDWHHLIELTCLQRLRSWAARGRRCCGSGVKRSVCRRCRKGLSRK